MDTAHLLDDLPPERRLALAYAPGPARPLMLGLFALDTRLGGIVRAAREPMLGQLKLSWWRDRLGAVQVPTSPGEPLLELLLQWGDQRAALAGLVDGWELLLDEGQIGAAALSGFAEARACACAALARRLGLTQEAEAARAGHDWALAELKLGLSDPAEIVAIDALLREREWRPVRLPRGLRPLQVLHGLSRRKQGAGLLLTGPGDGLVAVRLGLLGI